MVDAYWCLATGRISFVPYFARYPYETYVAPRSTHGSIADLDDAELSDFSETLGETLVRLENLWQMPLPYVMVLAPGTSAGRGSRFSFSHPDPSTASEARVAQVSRRSRNWRREFPERHRS